MARSTFVVLGILALLGFIWLRSDSKQSSTLMNLVGITETTGYKHQDLKTQEANLKIEGAKLKGKKEKLTHRIENDILSPNQEIIDQVHEMQTTWIDTIGADGILEYGILDAPGRMIEYFNSRAYENPILSRNTIEFKNMVVGPDMTTVFLTTSNLYGRIFFLSSEFTELMNSFSFFKDGALTSFIRQEGEFERPEMNFALQLTRQGEEADGADIRIQEYENWLKGSQTQTGPSVRIPNPANQ